MMKKRKDSGFTLIELMIVIAVIGILAIVLIPKVGTVKTQAKAAGLDTNIRLVQGYAESKIDKWISKTTADTEITSDFDKAFSGTNKSLTNPFTSVTLEALSGTDTYVNDPSLFIGDTLPASPATHNGTIQVIITGGDDTGTDPIESISIKAFGDDGEEITEKEVIIQN